MIMRILVTGGSGFIGTNLLEKLQADGHILLNIDVKPPQDEKQRSFWREVDLMDAPKVCRILEEFLPTHVVHLGARTDLDETKNLSGYAVNFEGTRNILSAAQSCETVQRMLVASTRLVCRIGYQPHNDFDYRPTTLYGESKVLTEKVTREINPHFTWCLLRFTSIWGPWFSVPYADFFLALARGHYIHPRGKRIHKSFGFIGNTVHQLCRMLAIEPTAIHQRTFYIADAPPLEVFEWSQMISRQLEKPPTKEMPLFLLRIAAKMGDLAKALGVKHPPLTSFRLANLLTEMKYDVDPIMKISEPLPCSLEQGVEQTIAWARKYGRL